MQELCAGPLYRDWVESSKYLKLKSRISSERCHFLSEWDHLCHLLAAFEQGENSL